MKRFSLFSAVLLSVIGSAVLAEGGRWTCERQAITHPIVKEQLSAIASNIGMRNIAVQYMFRWDAQEMRRQCEAYAAGKPAEISCLNGRRNWQEIEAMIPEDLFGLSSAQVRPHYLELHQSDPGIKAAFKYCQSVGASPAPGG